MLKIIAFSDSHNRIGSMIDIVQSEKPDLIFHLGDCTDDAYDLSYAVSTPISFIRGNNDYTFEVPESKIVELEDIKMFLCHGHTFAIYKGIGALLKEAKRKNCNIALFGHTHLPLYEIHDNIHILNPGSISLPRGGNRPSYSVITLDVGNIDIKIKFI